MPHLYSHFVTEETPGTEITIRTSPARSLTEAERASLVELAQEIRETGNTPRIPITRTASVGGHPLYETVLLYIGDDAGKTTVTVVTTLVTTATINWIKKRFSKASSQPEVVEREKIVTIYGPDGKPLKRIRATSDEDIQVTDAADSD